MANVQGGTISVVLQGKDVGLSSLLKQIQNDMQRGVTTAKQYDAAMATLDPVTRKNEQSLLSYAQSLARVAEKQGDVAGAQRILAQALGQVTPNTTAANNALNQLQGTIARQEQAIQKSSLSFAKLGQAFQGLIGSYFVVTQAAQTFAAAISAGNALEKQEATFRALSGSQEQYTKNLEVARAQQDRFGGSMTDTLENLSGFVNLSKRTGIELNKLADTARGLAIIDPVQKRISAVI